MIHGLKSRRPPESVIHHRLCEKAEFGIGSINAAFPETVAERIELVGELSLQNGLRNTVPNLLAPVSFHRRAAVMPDHRGCRKPDLVAPFQKPPADAHIISRSSEYGIETSSLQERGAAKAHVTAGNVFGIGVVVHH